MTLKKSHKWDEYESVDARCPHCGKWETYHGVGEEGDIICCDNCETDFQLGRQK